MQWIEENSVIALFLAFFFLYSLEFIIPLVQKKSRHFFSNVTAAGVLTVINLSFTSLTFIVSKFVHAYHIGIFENVQAPRWVTISISIIFLDFWAGYLVHVIFHKQPWLWKLHSVHHCDDLVDVTTTFRQHPVESIIRVAFNLSGMMILGIPLWVLLVYLTLSTLHAQLEHANIKIPRKIDRLLQYVIVTPNMHKVHHSRYQEQTDSNYSNILSVWDRIFGTFRQLRNYNGIDYGLDYLEEDRHYNYLELIKLPFDHIHPAAGTKDQQPQNDHFRPPKSAKPSM